MITEYLDMMGRIVPLEGTPKRIISLVPSQTELLYDIGAAGQIAGQTIFCVHPKSMFGQAVKVGGTKKVRYDVIRSLQPDLIICNKEENTEEIVNTLSQDYPVWVSDISTLEDACKMIEALGHITGHREQAEGLARNILSSFSEPVAATRRSCIYLIWKDPYMGAGAGTFIHEMLGLAGFDNLLSGLARYPEILMEEMAALKPEVVLLSSEPYPFKDKHIAELSTCLPESRIILADGEMFSWYGSRLVNSRTYFKKLQALLRN